ncbi:43196_t:CDS:1, partial [Gigaspora margarita]
NIKKETMDTYNYQKARDKRAVLSPHMSKINLNTNGLNSSIKATRVPEWIKQTMQQYAASRKHISAPMTNTGSE